MSSRSGRAESRDGSRPDTRARSLSTDAARSLSRNQRGELESRTRATSREVESSVVPLVTAFKRLREAIVSTEKASQSNRDSIDSAGKEFEPSGAGLNVIFIGDNTPSMSETTGSSGFLNINQNTTFAKIEREIMGLTTDAFMELSSDDSPNQFRGQGILFGFPSQLELGDKTWNTSDKNTGAFAESNGVYAKEVTPLQSFTSADDKAGMFLFQESSDFRQGPSLLAPALKLAEQSFDRNGVTQQKIREGNEVAVVVVTSDFELHDVSQAQDVVERMRKKGIRVIGVGIEGDNSQNTENHSRLESIMGRDRSSFCHTPEDLVTLINHQVDLEDQQSGITTPNNVSRRSARTSGRTVPSEARAVDSREVPTTSRSRSASGAGSRDRRTR